MNLDFNRICRLCLRVCEQYVELHQSNGVKSLSTEITEVIKFCYHIQIDLTDGLPTKVCYQCVQVLSYFNVTRKNVVNSEQLLRNVLCLRKKLEKAGLEITAQQTNDVEPKTGIQGNNSDVLKINYKPDTMQPKSVNSNFIYHVISDSNCEVEEGEKSVKGGSEKQELQFKEKTKLLNLNQNPKKYLRIHLGDQKKKLEPPFNVKEKKEMPCRFKEKIKAEEAPSEVTKEQKEKNIKVIGTIIDKGNILSPDVKRRRNSVLAGSFFGTRRSSKSFCHSHHYPSSTT